MTHPPQRTGGCLCGAVRFTVTAPPLLVRTCWCRLCQALGAGSATVNAGFPAEAVRVTGPLATYTSTADSGTVLDRSFCPNCGTPLFSQAHSRRNQMFIRVGAMDQRDDLGPQVTIWASQAPPWAAIDPGLPRVETQPPPAA